MFYDFVCFLFYYVQDKKMSALSWWVPFTILKGLFLVHAKWIPILTMRWISTWRKGTRKPILVVRLKQLSRVENISVNHFKRKILVVLKISKWLSQESQIIWWRMRLEIIFPPHFLKEMEDCWIMLPLMTKV